MRIIYVSRCRVCPCLVHVSCGVKCFYGPPVSSVIDDLDSISPYCPLAEAPTSEEMGSAKTQPPTCAAVNVEAPLPASAQ